MIKRDGPIPVDVNCSSLRAAYDYVDYKTRCNFDPVITGPLYSDPGTTKFCIPSLRSCVSIFLAIDKIDRDPTNFPSLLSIFFVPI